MKSKEMTVRDLRILLLYLPEDTPIMEIGAVYYLRAHTNTHGFMVYEKGDLLELHIDDGQASHPTIDDFRKSLLEWCEAR